MNPYRRACGTCVWIEYSDLDLYYICACKESPYYGEELDPESICDEWRRE